MQYRCERNKTIVHTVIASEARQSQVCVIASEAIPLNVIASEAQQSQVCVIARNTVTWQSLETNAFLFMRLLHSVRNDNFIIGDCRALFAMTISS